MARPPPEPEIKGQTVHRIIPILIAVTVGLATIPADACPQCSEGIRKQVIAGIFDENFGNNLLFTIAPFLIFGALTAAIHFSGPERVTRDENPDRSSEKGR